MKRVASVPAISAEPDLGPLLRTLRRLRHDLVILLRCMSEPLTVAIRASAGEGQEAMATALSSSLRELARTMAERKKPPDIDDFERAIDQYIILMEPPPEGRHDVPASEQ
jgi:hypothetical protein